jgi:hypothetical protein
MMPIRELAETWASLYSNSVALRSAVSFAHVGSLITGGGTAIAADLGMLSALRRGDAAVRDEIARLHAWHRVGIGSLTVVVVSGLLLLFKDLDALLESRPFWIKMALFAALILNGGFLVRVERRAAAGDARAMRMLRLSVVASLVLWLATTLAGTVVPNAL